MNDQLRTRENLIRELAVLREEIERLKSDRRETRPDAAQPTHREKQRFGFDDRTFESVLNAIPVAVLVYDAITGKYAMANQRARTLYGQSFIGMSVESYFRLVHATKLDGNPYDMGEMPIIQSLASGAIVRNTEMIIQRPDGERIQVVLNTAPIYDDQDCIQAVIVALEDVRDIRQLELAKNESQNRQAFLLRLSDRLRPVSDPIVIQSIAVNMLGEFLNADNAFYVEINPNGQFYIKREYHKPDAPPRAGSYGMDMLNPDVLAPLFAGRTQVMHDLRQSPLLDKTVKAALTDQDFLSFVTVPLNKQGRLLSFLSVLCLKPRNWRDSDISLIEEVADRTWAAVERALAEESLQASEEKFRTVLENVHEGIFMLDIESDRLVYVSPSMQAISGFSETELLRFSLKDILARTHPDDFEAYSAIYSQLAQSGDITPESEYRWRIRGGEYRWFCDRRSVIRDAEGRPVGLVEVIRDVTEQKEYENRIAFQSHLLENVHDAIIATDDQFRLTFWNERAESLFGWTAAEAIGRTTLELLHPILSERTRDEAIGQLLANDFYAGEVTYRHKDGTGITVDNRARLIRDAQGKVLETVTSIRDIRAWKAAEAALKESRQHAMTLVDQLQESDRNKNRFISVLSHELRNPLAAIVMGLELLEHEGVSQEQKRRAMDILNRQSEHLSCLVDDLLDVTRITENKIKLKLERIELCSFIQQMVLDHQASFETKGISLAVILPPEPITVEADSLRLNQIVTNLLHNALKFTRPADSVMVTVCHHDPIHVPEIGKAVCIKVADTGVGMDPELLRHLFVPFTQADRSLDRAQSGLGLGLSIVKGMVELHGGRVEAASDGIGKGSTFTVILPVAE